jgi:hypothetical protein
LGRVGPATSGGVGCAPRPFCSPFVKRRRSSHLWWCRLLLEGSNDFASRGRCKLVSSRRSWAVELASVSAPRAQRPPPGRATASHHQGLPTFVCHGVCGCSPPPFGPSPPQHASGCCLVGPRRLPSFGAAWAALAGGLPGARSRGLSGRGFVARHCGEHVRKLHVLRRARGSLPRAAAPPRNRPRNL